MTGGMAFIYDEKNNFENFANQNSIIWQPIETEYWIKVLKDLLKEFQLETGSKMANKILSNFENELKRFVQVCPIEMLDKLDNPITLKETKTKSA